jgi:hypothetical protein
MIGPKVRVCIINAQLNKIATFSPIQVNSLSQPHDTLRIKTDCVKLNLYEAHAGEIDTGPHFFLPSPPPPVVKLGFILVHRSNLIIQDPGLQKISW